MSLGCIAVAYLCAVGYLILFMRGANRGRKH